MPNSALNDVSAFARVALAGLLLAGAALAWVLLRNRGGAAGHRLQALTLLTLFLSFDLVLFGAYTRLSDSGLGCPDWPGCYGHASPVGAQFDIAVAQSALPSGPVTHRKAWVEMLHRYLATGVGALLCVLVAARWRAYRRGLAGGKLRWWAIGALGWVCVQGAFGALTVTMKLYPAVVTAHLLGGMLLLALLAAQVARFDAAGGIAAPFAMAPALRRALLLVGALLLAQIALGGWVSSNYAVLACGDFPTCQGEWWPPMDFASAFTLRRELGRDAAGAWLPFQALTAIHYAHRLLAGVVLAALLLLARALAATAGPSQPTARRWAAGVAALAAWQLASGLSNVVLGWPIVAAVAHIAGAAALVIVLTAMAVRTRAAGGVGVQRADTALSLRAAS